LRWLTCATRQRIDQVGQPACGNRAPRDEAADFLLHFDALRFGVGQQRASPLFPFSFDRSDLLCGGFETDAGFLFGGDKQSGHRALLVLKTPELSRSLFELLA